MSLPEEAEDDAPPEAAVDGGAGEGSGAGEGAVVVPEEADPSGTGSFTVTEM